MTKLRAFLYRALMSLRRSRVEADIEEEIRSHLEMEAEEQRRKGMNLDEARQAALRNFGGVDQVREQYRDHYRFQWVETLLQDFRFALRMLRKNPGFTAVAVMMLALAIGVNAAVFTVTNAVLFKGFPLVDRNDRILYIANGYGCCVSYPDFQDWRAQARSFEGMAVVHGVEMTLSDESGFTRTYDGTEVSSDTFKLVGQQPMIGRDFESSDEIPGAAPVAILTHGLWEGRYEKDPAIVGRTVRINEILTTVIGVMPQGFSFPQKVDLWVPLTPTPSVQRREARSLWFAFGRMADGVTVQSARAEMESMGKRLSDAYPLTNRDQLPVVQNFGEFFIGPNATMIYSSMWGAVGIVLLIACANLANCMLADAIGRTRETSVRIAVGAGRWRIIRQFLVESLMLSALGGVLGWWIAKVGVRGYALAMAHNLPWMVIDYAMDYRVLGYLIAISAGTGLLFGLAPAIRISKLDVNAALKDGGRSSTIGGRKKHLSAVLVMGEMALAAVLLTAAGVMIRSFLNVYAGEVGVKTSNILTADLRLPDARYPSADARISFYDILKTRLEALPGVESVAITNGLPTWGASRLPYELAGALPIDLQQPPSLSALVIGPDYFKTLGASVLSGREFNDADGVSGVPVVIVNRMFADKHWPGENPLGKRLRLFEVNTPEAWITVVGVVSNIFQNDASRHEFDPLVYLPYRQRPARGMAVLVRTRVSPGSVALAFRSEVQALDSGLSVSGLSTLTERLKTQSFYARSSGIIAVPFLILATIALLIASIGLYAVIAYSVSQRTQEIGVRMAVGATTRDILILVFKQGAVPLAIGLIVGLTVSFVVNRVLSSELVQVSPNDPVAVTVAAAVLVVSAALGCWIPARRAMGVDPVVALRHE